MVDISKKEIDRIGNRIKNEYPLSDEMMEFLYNYRLTFKNDLFKVFGILCDIADKINPSIIVTNRIKKYDSIIVKLKRIKDFKLSKMADIGGCRCITNDEKDIYKIIEMIEKTEGIEIKHRDDYINNKKDDGYKSYHLRVILVESKKTIEIQLRTVEHHNWATLVEITDELFEINTKTSDIKNEFSDFHLYLSNQNDLSIGEMKYIAQIIKNKDYIKRLSNIFSKNYIEIRKQWYNLEKKRNHNFFLIQIHSDKLPIINSFADQNQAEIEYFKRFKQDPNSNLFLTYLKKVNYDQISKGYANYILTYHSFLNESYKIIKDLILLSMKSYKFIDIFKYYYLYDRIIMIQLYDLKIEVENIKNFILVQSKGKRNFKRNTNDWLKHIEKRMTIIHSDMEKFRFEIREVFDGSTLMKYSYLFIVNIVSKYNLLKNTLIKINHYFVNHKKK